MRFEASAHLPLLVAGDVPGTLSLVWDRPRTPTPAEEGLVLALARYTAQAVARAVLLAEQESVATTLQRALLGELPAPAGLELAARYLPSSAGAQVGGDWWDAFEDSDGAPVLVIGDVTGHDVRAAATMGQLRAMLRGFAFEAGEPPAHALGRLDAAVAGLRVGALATAVVARVDPGDDGGRVLSWSNAGHPPPLLRSPTAPSRCSPLPPTCSSACTPPARAPPGGRRCRRAAPCCSTPTGWSSAAAPTSTAASPSSPGTGRGRPGVAGRPARPAARRRARVHRRRRRAAGPPGDALP